MSSPSTSRILAVLASLLLVGAAVLPTASLAQEDEEDEEANESGDAEQVEEADDDEETDDRLEEKRKVRIETDGSDADISLERETGPREDEVEMRWKAEEATFELEHESENQTEETENELEVIFGALVEYLDESDNGRYDPGEPIAGGWMLGDEFDDEEAEDRVENEASWGPASIDDITRDGKNGKRITSSASLGDEGTFELRFLVFGDFVELNGSDLSPTGAKIDIEIEDYPYQANETDLALFLETETENEFEREIEEEDERGVSAAGADDAGSSLVVTWKNTAEVDGTTRAVNTTMLEQKTETETDGEESATEEERRFVLSYPRGDAIVHDPKAEVQMGSAAHSGVPAAGALAVLATLVAVAATLRRSRTSR